MKHHLVLRRCISTDLFEVGEALQEVVVDYVEDLKFLRALGWFVEGFHEFFNPEEKGLQHDFRVFGQVRQ